MTVFVQTSSEETRSWSSSPLIVNLDIFSPWTWAHLHIGRSICLNRRMSLYIFIYHFSHLRCLCTDFYDISALYGCWFLIFIKRIIYKCLNVSFWLNNLRVVGKFGSHISVKTHKLVGSHCFNWPSDVGTQSLCNWTFWWRFRLVTLPFSFVWWISS